MAHFNDLSFLPDDYLSTRRARRANRLFSALLAVAIGAVGVSFFVADTAVAGLRRENAEVTARFEQERTRLARIDEIRKQHEAIAYRARLADALIEKLPRSLVLNQITDHLPEGVSLIDVTLDTKQQRVTPQAARAAASEAKKKAPAKKGGKDEPPPPPEPPVLEQTLRVVGVARDDIQLAHFMNNLADSPLMQDVDLTLSKQHEYLEVDVRRFEISMKLNTKTTAADLVPAGAGPTQQAAIDQGGAL